MTFTSSLKKSAVRLAESVTGFCSRVARPWCVVAFAGALICPAVGDDAAAAAMRTRAQSAATSGTLAGCEEYLSLLYTALSQAETDSLRQELKTEIMGAYRDYTQRVRKELAPFLDVPDKSQQDFYQSLITSCRDPRALRLMGELMIEQGNPGGWKYLQEAAALRDPRAIYLAAECYARQGKISSVVKTAHDPRAAWSGMAAAAAAGYAPAAEKMAEICWDEIPRMQVTTMLPVWGADRHNPYRAIHYLSLAIREYSRWANADTEAATSLQSHLTRLEGVLRLMRSLASADEATRKALLGDYVLCYRPMYLMQLGRDNDGLRMRYYYLQQMLQADLACLTDVPGASLDLSRLLITTGAQAEQVPGSIHVPAGTEPLISAAKSTSKSLQSFLQSEAELAATMVRELVKQYFGLRYSLLKGTVAQAYDHSEGHAQNAALSLLTRYYFQPQVLTPARYAELFIRDEQGTACFHWFRNNFLLADGSADWAALDLLVKDAAARQGIRGYRPGTQAQPGAETAVSWKPRYFGRGGYLCF